VWYFRDIIRATFGAYEWFIKVFDYSPTQNTERQRNKAGAMTTYSAEQIASYLLTRPDAQDNDMSNLKLQKLCYYAQGLISTMRGGEPLFKERIDAWDHGPVVEALYHKYKQYGSQPIPVVTDFDVNQIDEADRNALDDIYEYYGQYSPWRLRNMTHEEKPWTDAYHSTQSRTISLEAMMEFFSPQIDADYVSGIYGKAD
jgi:uncharacterized phage-associated protein